MIRFIIVCIIVGSFLILSLPVLLIEWIIGKKWPRARDISSLRIIQGVFKLILKVSGVKITEIGRDNLPDDRPFLLVANHRSYFDILILYSLMPDLTCFVAKKEMNRYPVLNLWMRRLYCLFLDREDLRQGMKVIQTAIEYVKGNISVVIFPEGTRNKNPDELDMLPFHEGSFRVTTKSGCPLIPAALSNTQEIFEAHFPKIRPTHVIVDYLSPVDPSSLSRPEQKTLGAATQQKILERLSENQAKI